MPLHKKIQATFLNGGLQAVFKDVLGWDSKLDEFETFDLGGKTVAGRKIASVLNGAAVFEFDFSPTDDIPPRIQRSLSNAIGRKYPERVIVLRCSSMSTWLWPKKTSSGAVTHERHLICNDSLPLFLAQRLAGLAFSGAEMMAGITISQVRQKLQGAFETGKVTKKFYEEFHLQQQALASTIDGLEPDEAQSYAVLLLNRLMFIYFLQKKEFLNSDSDFLRNCLAELKSLEEQNVFYNFYEDLLLVLFFDGLNSQTTSFKDPKIAHILGTVPYINGGIFGQSEIEKANDISIPDSSFLEVFDFFDSFNWHLDTRPSGNPNEINPEVIGYIFEQYINFNASGKKENGAYYTKHDVTGYMVGQTLVPKLLDQAVAVGLKPMKQVTGSGIRYIQPSLLHGWDNEEQAWMQAPEELVAAWSLDPTNWYQLDSQPLDPAICLGGETWVEMFHRRSEVEALVDLLATGSLAEIDDLITHNLNGQLLLEDCILGIKNDEQFQSFWVSLTSLSVLDPTCGSGAFLFAALEVLEDVYARLLDAAEDLAESCIFAKSILTEALKHANRRYFVRKKAALSNLFGTDLMPDAIETAKLRVFLALAACLDEVNEIEPLPDLDFNLKVGNLLVGILDPSDAERLSDRDVFASKALATLEPKIQDFASQYSCFVTASFDSGTNPETSKKSLQELAESLRRECDSVMGKMLLLSEEETDLWASENHPFHWFIEFPQIIAKGGFDVIVGNPPYVRLAAKDHKSMFRAGTRGYEVVNSRDIYAYCYERSLRLLNESGRHAFIVPVNLAFSSDFEKMRGLLSRCCTSQWWSTFDQLPQGLFEGAAIRNTIHIGSQTGVKAVFSTHHQIFTVATRPWLFESLRYYPSLVSGSMPPGRAGVSNSLVDGIRKRQGGLGKTVPAKLTLKSTANYWVPVHPQRPPILDLTFTPQNIIDNKVKELAVGSEELEIIVLALLSGKIGFIWWQAMGDGFDTIESTFDQLRVAFKGISNDELEALAQEVLEAGLANTVVNMYKGLNYVSIRWAGIREVSDKFDKLALERAGFGAEWRNLNILYRQIMRANESRQMNQDLEANRKLWIGL